MQQDENRRARRAAEARLAAERAWEKVARAGYEAERMGNKKAWEKVARAERAAEKAEGIAWEAENAAAEREWLTEEAT